MMTAELTKKLDEFIEKNKRNIVEDIKTLLNIKSVSAPAVDGAPFGEGVKKALDAALALCEREGFRTESLEGHVGYAHYGDEERFIGMIAHIDVVPEGEGWDTDPYNCVEREGFLLARGAEDNKSPFVMSLYAMKFLKENGVPLKYGMRLLAGCDEETGMSDVEHYLSCRKAPLFTLVPDSTFPVGHGEKGIFTGDLVSKKPLSAGIIELSGGVASNVIPERAHAVLNIKLCDAPKTENFEISGEDGKVRIDAFGIAGHASRPVGSRNAIIMLLKYIINNKLACASDLDILGVIANTLDVDYGEKLGIASDDGIFTPLTCIGGMIEKLADGRLCQNLNCRYPTSIDGETIAARLNEFAAAHDYEGRDISYFKTHFISAESEPIKVLMDCYNRIMGTNEKPYVMSGGTYARHIPNAVTFGAEFPDEKKPPFVGTIHGKNEGVSLETVFTATKLYANALYELQSIEL